MHHFHYFLLLFFQHDCIKGSLNYFLATHHPFKGWLLGGNTNERNGEKKEKLHSTFLSVITLEPFAICEGPFFGQYPGPSRNNDPRPFTCCFCGLGLVYHS